MELNSRLCLSKISDRKQRLHKETGNYTLGSASLRYKLKTNFAQRSMDLNSRLYASKISYKKQSLH